MRCLNKTSTFGFNHRWTSWKKSRLVFQAIPVFAEDTGGLLWVNGINHLFMVPPEIPGDSLGWYVCFRVKLIVSTVIFERKYAPILCAWILCYATLVPKARKTVQQHEIWIFCPKDVITFSEINRWQVITIYILLMTGVLQMLSHSRRWLGPPLVASRWVHASCVLCLGGCVSVL